MANKKALSVLISFICIGLSLNSIAQIHEQQKTDSVFQLVKKQFNAKKADSLYALAGASLKQDLIIETFRNICTNSLFPLGKITGETLISFQNNKIATYKITFDTSDPWQLLMSLDNTDKLQLFLFQPYEAPVGSKMQEALSSNPLLSALDKKIDAPARAYIQKGNTVGLSIGIYKDGKVSTYNYGETRADNNKLPTANSIYEIGAITNTFTAILLAYDVTEGRVRLNDPITKFLPDSVAKNSALKGITLAMLGNHTSGLPRLPEDFRNYAKDASNPYKDYSKNDMFAYLKSWPGGTKPGEQYAYSNFGAALLGEILDHISGKSFEQLATDIIIRPLAMNSTIQTLTPLLKPRVVSVYDEYGNPTPLWDQETFAPAEALKSTVNNMLLYAVANMTNAATPLSKAMALTRQVTYSKDLKVGLGWHIIAIDGVEYYFHDGDTGGCSSFIAFNADKKIALVVLSNSVESVNDMSVDILRQLQ